MTHRSPTEAAALAEAKTFRAQKEAVKRDAILRLIRAGQTDTEIARTVKAAAITVRKVRQEVADAS